MLKRRVIPALLLSKGRVVKGKSFSNFRDTGDPVSAAKIYNAQNADELVFLDIDANRGGSDFKELLQTVSKVAQECFMPLSVGGGIKNMAQVDDLFSVGADKVVLTTSAIKSPQLIELASKKYGSQAVIVGIDIKKVGNIYKIYSQCGNVESNLLLKNMIEECEKLGAGEFLVNSIDKDGAMTGYDLELLEKFSNIASRPVIAMGGAGNFEHLYDALSKTKAHSVACASIFHFADNNPIRARSYLLNKDILMKKIK